MKTKLTYFLMTLLLLAVYSLTSCKSDKKRLDTKTNSTELKVNTGESYNIDVLVSQVTWTGSKPTGSHTGTIAIQSGSLMIYNKNITGGNFVLDMNSLTNTDLSDPSSKAKLEGHLKGSLVGSEDDFFNVKKYPTANFKITKVEKNTNGTATHNITGDLTIKSITKRISFPVSVILTVNNEVIATATGVKINRTDFGINFKSKNIFKNLGDKFIYDDFTLNINLKGKK